MQVSEYQQIKTITGLSQVLGISLELPLLGTVIRRQLSARDTPLAKVKLVDVFRCELVCLQ
jgi:hypothetical protein